VVDDELLDHDLTASRTAAELFVTSAMREENEVEQRDGTTSASCEKEDGSREKADVAIGEVGWQNSRVSRTSRRDSTTVR